MNLPVEFMDRMRRLLGEEFEEFISNYSKPYLGGIRVNTARISPDEFKKICPFKLKRIPWIHNGYYYEEDTQPARHPHYYAGLYYIQEPSAMTPASLLPVTPGDKILDLCAAPGGKSTELGARLKGKGMLVANDISVSRARALIKNIELFGISNAIIMSEDPKRLVGHFYEYFDKILVDAPCSGEGMFRKSPAIMKNWEQYGVDYYNRLQKDIILSAAQMLRPGGYMLYSTCTFSPEENEGTISYLLDKFPEFRVVDALHTEHYENGSVSYEGFCKGRPDWVEGGRPELKNCIRLWPHRIDAEGHFIALLKKEASIPGQEDESSAAVQMNTGNSSNKNIMSTYYMPSSNKGKACVGKGTAIGKGIAIGKDIAIGREAAERAFEFIKDMRLMNGSHLLDQKDRFKIREDKLYMVPEGNYDLSGLRILREGLLLGELKKDRFEPSQALANALDYHGWSRCIDLASSSGNVIRYLKCESIVPEGHPEDGWHLVCSDGYPLGWCKITGGVFKNKYPPGWRWM